MFIALIFVWVLGTIATLATFILCGLLGYWIARKIGWPGWVGALIGGFGHLIGCAFLGLVWLVQLVVAGTASDREAARIDRAKALLQSYGFGVTPPPNS